MRLSAIPRFVQPISPVQKMPKDHPTQLHIGYESSTSFKWVVREAIYRIRTTIELEAQEGKRAEPAVGGAIHALRKLCESEQQEGSLVLPEQTGTERLVPTPLQRHP